MNRGIFKDLEIQVDKKRGNKLLRKTVDILIDTDKFPKLHSKQSKSTKIGVCRINRSVYYKNKFAKHMIIASFIIIGLFLSNSLNVNFVNALEPNDPVCELDGYKDTYACNNELPPPTMPDLSCQFDSSQEHCKAPPGGCPDKIGGIPYGNNEDDRCTPKIPCPSGTHWAEDDESGQCYSDEEGCQSEDYILIDGGCQDKDDVCRDHPDLDECKVESDTNNNEGEIREEDVTDTQPYKSGYGHGCDDAKINNPSDRYINQSEKGPAYHTDAFMDGYYDGFRICAVNVFDNDGSDDNNDGNGDKFIVRIKFIDDTPHMTLYGPTFVRAYIGEHPNYSTANLDLNDLWIDAVPSGSSQIYITDIVMPSGLIENGEEFHLCVEDLDNIYDPSCFNLTNSYENEPVEVVYRPIKHLNEPKKNTNEPSSEVNEEITRITGSLKRSGGFAGITETVSFDSDSGIVKKLDRDGNVVEVNPINKDALNHLMDEVSNSDFFTMSPSPRNSEFCPDTFHYDLSITLYTNQEQFSNSVSYHTCSQDENYDLDLVRGMAKIIESLADYTYKQKLIY